MRWLLPFLLSAGLALAQQTTAPNPPTGDNSNRIATTSWVNTAAGGGILAGDVTGPVGTNTVAKLQGTTFTGTTGSGAVCLGTAPTISSPTISGGTFSSPTLTTPALGTPASGNLASCTGYPQSALGGLGTGVSTALGITANTSGGFATYPTSGGTPAVYQSTSLNPTGTTSTTGVMMGLAGTLTPTYATRMLVMIAGNIEASTTTVTCTVKLYYGTGSAPSNGDAITGTNSGQLNSALIVGNDFPIPIQAIITGLTVGTPYWLDVVLSSNNSSATCTIRYVSLSAHEL